MTGFFITAEHRGVLKNIEIMFPNGAGGENAHIYADRFYQGIFLKYRGKWELRAQKDDHGFTGEVVRLMIDRLQSFNEDL